MTKKKLSIKECILLMGLIPQNHDYLTLKELKEMKKELTLTEEENRKFDVDAKQAPDGRWQVTFNEEASADYLKEIKIKPRAIASMAEVLKTMDKNKQLDERLLSLYEKFVG